MARFEDVLLMHPGDSSNGGLDSLYGLSPSELHCCYSLATHFLPSLRFHSLVLEEVLNLFVGKVQNARKFLHLLEAEVLLLLKPVIEHIQLDLGEHSSHLLPLDLGFSIFLLHCVLSRLELDDFALGLVEESRLL
jgi:hypothetical protein